MSSKFKNFFKNEANQNISLPEKRGPVAYDYGGGIITHAQALGRQNQPDPGRGNCLYG